MKRVIISTVILAALICNVLAVTFEWQPSYDPGVTGYRLYFGSSPRTYSSATNCGNVVRFSISNTQFVTNKPIYVSITAYNNAGLESDYANECTFCIINGEVKMLPSNRLRTASK